LSLKEEFLALLERDREFRYAVAGLLGLEEILKSIRSLQEQVASLQKQVVEHSRVIAEHSKRIEEHSKRIEGLTKAIQALGARWGLLAEESFRSGMKGLVEEYFGGRVERWSYYDGEGFVFGYPSMVEVDLLIKDEEHILVEVESNISRADVSKLWKTGRLYEKLKSVKPRLVLASPYIEDKAKEAAQRLSIETYTAL